MILEFRHHLHNISKNMRCLKVKTQDDNCEQATKNFSLHDSKPIYFDFRLNLHDMGLKKKKFQTIIDFNKIVYYVQTF